MILATHLLIIIAITGLFAGFIDAIVGGGGLLTTPVLLACGLPPHITLGTNKVAASIGVMSSALVYLRKNIYNIKLWLFILISSLIGAAIGAVCIHFISAKWLNQVIPILIIIIAIYMALPKTLCNKGQATDYKPPKLKGGILGITLGFYDGFFGPGTGSFWTSGLIFFFKLDLLQATAIAKLMNFSSNIIAAILFMSYGSVNYSAAFFLMFGYVIGSYCGAHTAIKHGRKLIKPLFLLAVSALAIKLIWQYWF